MGSVRLEVDHRHPMLSTVRFRAGRLDQGRFHLPRDDVTGRNQARGAVVDLFKFAAFDVLRDPGQGRMLLFPSRDPASRHTRARGCPGPPGWGRLGTDRTPVAR